MIRTMKLAKINLTMQTGTIVRWLKKEGERVERDEPLLEVETDKAVNTVESFYAGYLKKILVPEGQEVPVDTLIAYIGEKEDEVPAEPPAGEGIPAASASARPVQAAAKGAGAQGRDPERLAAGAPPGRRAGRGLGHGDRQRARRPHQQGGRAGRLAARGLSGRGRAGRRDAGAADVRPEEAHRRAHESQLPGGAPHLSGGVGPGRRPGSPARPAERRRAGEAERFTLTDLLVRAVSLALKENPLLNATLRGGKILAFDEQGIGVAVAGPGGLVVPVLRGCQGLSIQQIRDRRRELVARAREGRQTAEDLGGGTFTITNLGMYGVDAFRPILYPGQAAILAVGAMRRMAVADEAGKLSAQPVLQLTLGCDHRIVDGAEGAVFLRRLKELLEQGEEL